MRVHLTAYAVVLTLLALMSWLGCAWGYFVLYGFVLVCLAVVVGVVSLVLAWRARSEGRARGRAFRLRILRSFSSAQVTLSVALAAAVVFARLTSGPLGPVPGGAFEDAPSQEPFEEALAFEGDEIQLQISTASPYTITTHAFVIGGALYVGADFAFPFKRWIYLVQEDPDVLVRIGGQLFERRAVRIDDPEQSRRLLEEVSRQRGVDVDDWLTEVWFFRMEARS